MCNYILSHLINCKKLQWLLNVKNRFFLYSTIISVVLVLIVLEYIRFSHPSDIILHFLILTLLFVLSIVGFLYGTGSLMKVPANIDSKILCMGSFMQIFGFFIVFLTMSFILLS